MSINSRLDRLSFGLTPRERAILILRDFKDRKRQDSSLGRGMDPPDQREYNRLIRLMNACNREVLTVFVMLWGRVQKIELKLGWLATLEMWGEHADMIEWYLQNQTKEPITETAYRALVSAEPDRWAPASELADVLTSRKTDWKPEQMEDAEAQVVLPAEWEKESARNQKLLAALVKAGTLESRKAGGELMVRLASFNAWSGQEAPLRPAFGLGYDPAPDGDVGLVDQLQASRAEVRRSFTSKAFKLPDWTEHWPLYRALAGGLQEVLQRDLQATWAELAALDAALAEVAREFDGEDPLRPETRAELEEAIQSLRDTHEALLQMGVECELAPADPEETRETLAIIRHFGESYA